MLTAILRLVRAGTLLSPAADVTAGLCLRGLPWTGDAVRALLASVLVYAAGMVLNDHADRHEDATARPERPIPSGEIGPSFAFTLGLALLAGGVLCAPSRPYWAAMALLVLAYDYVLKRVPAAGAATMGLLRALNLSSGALAIQGGGLDRTVLIAAAAYGCYIFAVTVLGMFEDDSRAKPRAIRSVQSVPPLVASLALLGMPHPWPAAGIGFVLAAAFLGRLVTVRRWTREEIRVSMTWLLLGTMAYTGLLCAGAGRWLEATAVWAAIVPARWISRRISLT